MILILLLLFIIFMYALYVSYMLLYYEVLIGNSRRRILSSGGAIFHSMYYDNANNDKLKPIAQALVDNDCDELIRHIETIENNDLVLDNIMAERPKLEEAKNNMYSFLSKKPHQYIASFWNIQPHKWERKTNGNQTF